MDSKADIHPEHSPAVSPFRRGVRSAAWARVGNIAPLAVLLGVVFGLHFVIPGIVPSGAQPGRWLALAEEILGSEVMSAEVPHPPLLPALIALMLMLGIPPLAALLTAALLAKASLVIAVYLTGLTLNRFYATVAAALVATAAAQMELYARGGYGQLLGMGLGLLAVFLVVRYLDTGEGRHLWYGLGLGAAGLASDLLIVVLLPLALAVAVATWLFMVVPDRRVRARTVARGATVVGLTTIVVLALFLLWGRSAGEPLINPPGLSRWESLFDVFGDASWLWAVLVLGAVIVIPLRHWPRHVAASLAVAAGWLVTSGALFGVTGEQSSLLISQTSVIILVVLGFGAAHQQLLGPEPRRRSRKRSRPIRHRLLLIAGISVLNALVVVGLVAYFSAADQYRLVDDAELSALDRLRTESGSGDLTVAARGKDGMPVGWWVEGYATVPTYTAHEPRLWTFPEEQEQTNVTNDIFSGALGDAETIAMLESIGADYLAVDRRGPDAAFLDSDLAGGMNVVDDSSNLVILDVTRDG